MVTVMYGATKAPVSLPAAIAQRWYTANRETVDVLDDGDPQAEWKPWQAGMFTDCAE
jgi:hypothetical protein